VVTDIAHVGSCFNCAVVEVYTLTEAVGIVSATNPSDQSSLHVGAPIASLGTHNTHDLRSTFAHTRLRAQR
jgi:long-subunit acyl-CoA synthetase (AMP-forming)